MQKLLLYRFYLLLVFAFWTGISYSQESYLYPPYPIQEVDVPLIYLSNDAPELPYKVDNSELKFFSPIINQYLPTCGQIAGETYAFGYEMNRSRNLSAQFPENQYSHLFTYFFYTFWYGLSYLDSWEVIKDLGIPSVRDYYSNCIDTFDWMNGYENYYNAMKNRIDDYYSIPIQTLDDIKILKHWLHDHLDGSETGGVACFYANASWYYDSIGIDSEESGKDIIYYFSDDYIHAMTIVGYNDSIKYDRNHDGVYTTDIDVTGDGIVDIRDCEIGALKFANSFGDEWRNEGFCYMTYASAAYIWDQKVHVLKVKENYEPALTMKIKMKHHNRSAIKVIAGISNNIADTVPEYTIEFPVFNYQGGNYPFSYCTDEFEFGLDISTLRDFVKTDEVKIFLNIIDAEQEDQPNGVLFHYSVIDYNANKEYCYHGLNNSIKKNASNYYSVKLPLSFSGNQNLELITDRNLKVYNTQNVYQLEVQGGKPPYHWFLERDVQVDVQEEAYENDEKPDSILVRLSTFSGDKCTDIGLDFTFPYGNDIIDSVQICDNGWIQLFNTREKHYYYPYGRTTDLCYNVIEVLHGLDLLRRSFADSIYYKMTEEDLFVRWKLHVFDTLNSADTVDVALNINNTGRIDFYYKYVSTNQEWSSGFYYKDHGKYDLSERLNGIPQFKKISLVYNENGNITLDENGKLFIMSDKMGLYSILKVAVRDSLNVTHYKEFALMSNSIQSDHSEVYPNPFTTQTNIIFSLDQESLVSLSIFDITGKKLTVPIDNEILSGHQKIMWSGKNNKGERLPPGLYIYKLSINDQTESKRMILFD